MRVEGRGLVVTEEAGGVVPEVLVRRGLDTFCFGGPFVPDGGVVKDGCQAQALIEDIVKEGVGLDVLVLLACTLCLSIPWFSMILTGDKWQRTCPPIPKRNQSELEVILARPVASTLDNA